VPDVRYPAHPAVFTTSGQIFTDIRCQIKKWPNFFRKINQFETPDVRMSALSAGCRDVWPDVSLKHRMSGFPAGCEFETPDVRMSV
jgi:hypothetical protein